VHDLQVKDDALVVGTHGRSIWILDDLQPIRQYDATIAAEPLHLFAPQDAIRWRYGASGWGTRGGFPNPPHGALIYYALKDEEKGDLKIEILDSRNRIVRTLSSTAPKPMGSGDFESADEYKDDALPRGAGVQRAVWNLAYEGAEKIEGGRIDTGDPREGPRVPPGTYTVKLTAAGKTLTAPLKVLPDPRGDLSQTDLEAQAAFAVRVRDDISKLTGLVNELRSVQTQLKGRNVTLATRKNEADIADLIGQSEAAIRRAFAIESKLHNPTAEVVYDILAMRGGAKLYSRLSPLQMWAAEGNGVPTSGMMQVLVEQEKELSAIESEAKQFLSADVTKLNQRAAQLNLGYVIVK
jgi:hypothetical protein